MDRRDKIERVWILLVFHLILYVPSVAYAEDEFVVFKLIVNKVEVSQIETIYYLDHVYLSLPELMEKLGYRYQYDGANRAFATNFRRASLYRFTREFFI